MEELFVYGGLKVPEMQKKVFGRVVEGTPDVMLDYSQTILDIDGQMYPLAIPKDNAEIPGVVLLLSPLELKHIDDFLINVYKRVKVTLKSGKQVWSNVISDQVLQQYAKLLGI